MKRFSPTINTNNTTTIVETHSHTRSFTLRGTTLSTNLAQNQTHSIKSEHDTSTTLTESHHTTRASLSSVLSQNENANQNRNSNDNQSRKKRKTSDKPTRSLPKTVLGIEVGWWHVTEEVECAEFYESIANLKVFPLDQLEIVFPVYRGDVHGIGDELRIFQKTGGFYAGDVLRFIRSFYLETLKRKEVEKIIKSVTNPQQDYADKTFVDGIMERLRRRVVIQRKDLLDGLTFFERLVFTPAKNAYYLELTT
eukprot:TRINITY_DN10694_c0_g1_i1.p1 TRINITY_DN10694_c0_g1~~TRINITY_DN10694_c0_g1_i1.p1  ORF type:complete len:260 (+),score=43.47 TRINITY_DN10694_c0_g1_i1:26-781(+)